MKHIIFILIVAVFQVSFSQANIKLSSLDNGGGIFQSGDVSIVATIGEVSVNEYNVNNLNVSEGFIGKHQLNSQTSQNPNCITPPNNLISWWAAEDNPNDSVGHNDGTELGNVSYSSGVVNKAFSFDGIDDVVVVPHSADLDITGDVTVELWAKQTGFATVSQQVIAKGGGYVPEDVPTVFSMRFENATFQCIFEDNTGANIVLTGPSFEDFQWHHYVYVRQGNQHSIYADGFHFGWETFTNGPASTVGLPLTIGGQYHNPNGAPNDYTNFFSGEIDEVGVYNRALTETEIQSIYNAGANGKCSVTLNIEDDKVSSNEVKIYPNPVRDILTLKLDRLQKNGIFELYDLLGNKVKQLNNLDLNKIELNLSELNSGLYLYVIKDGNSTLKSGKLVKQ
ncbi:LamG-like jellyroll fold domain-containing protein [Seonamhaeicola marinus]|uniref:T9SS type A sorting domain-containing protein n=1 Tax=Seonamhaeicola marinus TaxID=1912246 RepID=A0A5D0J726_9FLAO|nr:LamG-like jellyroll fold domain-containing protein [Seonamhaeicola marinus]TYA92165.1 T9SS type A sorting domain-containing protein [Seonamhaeicola marinus]